LCDPKLAHELMRGSGETGEFRANRADAAAKVTPIPNMPFYPEIPTPGAMVIGRISDAKTRLD
jgi:exosome complex RNA-binding protein Csl4